MDSTALTYLIQPVLDRAKASESAFFKDSAASLLVERMRLAGSHRSHSPWVLPEIRETQWIDRKVSAFFEVHPSGQGIEVNGGLSTRFHRLSALSDWPRFSWLMINSCAVSECLQSVFPKTDNLRRVVSETAAQSWPEFLSSKDSKALILIIGELEPVPPDQLKSLLEHSYEALLQLNTEHAQLLIRHTNISLRPLLSTLQPQMAMIDECNFSEPAGLFKRLARSFSQNHQAETTLTCIEFNASCIDSMSDNISLEPV